MKVLQIGDNMLSGHRFNGHDLGKYLREKSITSEHLVWLKNYDDGYTYEIEENLESRDLIRDTFFSYNQKYGTNSLFYPFSYEILFNKQFLDSDVVHLHLIHNNFFDISHLPIISNLKPVVWTIHDPWAITGHCIYPLECDRWKTGCIDCPDLEQPFKIDFDATSLNWEYKKIMIEASELDIVVASKWMYERVIQSPIFKNKNIHLVNFGIDLEKFKPCSSSIAKRRFNISENNVVIAFRSTESIYKGLDFIKRALKELVHEQQITLLTFNEKGLIDEFRDSFEIVELGWVTDDDIMIDAYNAADIFLMPSLAEAFGMMAIEAMACGKPVIVMEGTSLPEIVRPSESGCIVISECDDVGMSIQLQKLIKDSDLRKSIGERSRLTVEKYYNKDRYVAEIINVYKRVISSKKTDSRIERIIEQQKKNCIERNELKSSEKKFLKIISVTKSELFLIKLVRFFMKSKSLHFLWRGVLRPVVMFIPNLYRRGLSK